MIGFLSDLINWLNSNIISFSDGIEISQKSSFLHNFYISLCSVLKEWG